MTIQRKWIWIGGAIAGAGVLLALGVPLSTLLIVAAVLACPAMMFFGMRGTHQGGTTHQSSGMACHPGSQEMIRGEDAQQRSSIEPAETEKPVRKS